MSRQEHFVVVPAEAMASGRAVLLTCAAGVMELVETPASWGAKVVTRGAVQALGSALLAPLTWTDGRVLPDVGWNGCAHRQPSAVSRRPTSALGVARAGGRA